MFVRNILHIYRRINGKKLIRPKGLIINNYFLRRVLFDQVQHNGDCGLAGWFAYNQRQTSRSDAVEVNNFQEEKQ